MSASSCCQPPTLAELGTFIKANAAVHFPIIHTLFSNLKAWLVGSHHGVSAKHLARYLRAWAYRFNRHQKADPMQPALT